MRWWIIVAGLLVMAQGYDDPRVSEYTGYVNGIKEMQLHVLMLRAQICVKGRALSRPELDEYCQPMQFPPLMSVDEFRAKLPK